MWDTVRFLLCACLMVAGLFTEFTALFGVSRFRFCMNRIHAAGMGDTLGIMLMLLSVAAYMGVCWETLKLIAVIAIFWLTAPISSHLIGELIHRTDNRLSEEAEEWKS